MTKLIAFALFDGVNTLDFAGPAEVFAAANRAAGEEHYAMRSFGAGSRVRTGGSLVVEVEPFDAAPARLHTLFVPGAGERALLAALANAKLVSWIAGAAARAERVCSACSGAFLLGKAGLLDGRRATTHWMGLDWLQTAFTAVAVQHGPLFVEDGPVWTSAGVTSAIDMALALVERDLGAKVALAAARELVLFIVRPGGQAQFSAPLDLQARSSGTDLHALVPWLEAQLDKRLRVEDMANAVGMTERTFQRRCPAVFGRSPAQLLTDLRLERTRALLEDPDMPIKTIATQVGMRDAAMLGRLFKARYGTTPGAYRRAFGSGRVPPPAASRGLVSEGV